jgi:glycosyltransferase involved in cell wall biosynthesis
MSAQADVGKSSGVAMKLIVFTHPSFFNSNSMPRFAKMIVDGMRARGHEVDAWTAKARATKLPAPAKVKKWLGYIDQFLFFPIEIAARKRSVAHDTLFVFADQALGPWVPLVKDRPHVVHCHDFLGLQSAEGKFENINVSWTGRLYQQWIRRGFERASNFISVSEQTRRDLESALRKEKPKRSHVVYNGLNFPFERMAAYEAKALLASKGHAVPVGGVLLHVGGNQWYKNRAGVLAIYAEYARRSPSPLPMWMVGAPPPAALVRQAGAIERGEVSFLTGMTNHEVQACYSIARALVFPSLAEGFGWPIVEAMACGCPVVTTAQAPMSEIAGDVAWYLPPRQAAGSRYVRDAAQVLLDCLDESEVERKQRIDRGIALSGTFSTSRAIAGYEDIYLEVLSEMLSLEAVSSL